MKMMQRRARPHCLIIRTTRNLHVMLPFVSLLRRHSFVLRASAVFSGAQGRFCGPDLSRI